MEDRKIKGSYVQVMNTYAGQNFAPPQRDRVLAALSPDVRAMFPQAKRSEWYPIQYAEEFMQGIETVHGDVKKAEEDAVKLGMKIAEEAVGTFLKLLLKVLTPTMFVRQFPEFWRRYHNFGSLRYDLERISEKRVIMWVPGYNYLHGIGAGWVKGAFQAFSRSAVTVGWNVPEGQRMVPEVQWDVSWE